MISISLKQFAPMAQARKRYLRFDKNNFKKVMSSYGAMLDRCNNPKSPSYKYYGGKGIKCIVTYGQLLDLFYENKAWKLKRHSIDRIDPNGNYILGNIRFIEFSENSRRANLGRRKIKLQIV